MNPGGLGLKWVSASRQLKVIRMGWSVASVL